MKKYKDLLSKKVATWKKSFELWLVATEKRFLKAEKLVALLRRILLQATRIRLTRYITEKTSGDSVAVQTLVSNALEYFLANDVAFPKVRDTDNDKLRLDLIIRVARGVVDSLSQFVGVQPMLGPVAQCYKLVSKGEGKIELVAEAVSAVTKRLQAEWTVEVSQDVFVSHGLNASSELEAMIASEIVNEYVADAIRTILNRVKPEAEVVEIKWDTPFIFDITASLIEKINRLSAEIATTTERGHANFIICSPVVVSLLQASKASFAPAIEGSFKGPNYFQLAGTLDGKIRVYSYIFPKGDVDNEEQFIIGYKGTETDAGYIVCPYQVMQTTGMAVNPVTFQPVQNFYSRYAETVNSDNYYRVVTVRHPAVEVIIAGEGLSIQEDAPLVVEVAKKTRKKAPVAKYAKKTAKKATKKAVKKVPVPKKAVQASAPKAAKKAVKKVVKKVTKKKVVKKTK